MQVEPTKSTERKTNRSGRLSSDGKWRSFARYPNLLQYVSTGTYYGRVKAKGKIIRKSLKTSVWSTALLRLPDFLKTHRSNEKEGDPIPFTQALTLFETALEHNTQIKESSKRFRRWCIVSLKKSWPALWNRNVNTITPEECQQWAAKLRKEFGSQYFNNMIGTLKLVLQKGNEANAANGGPQIANPASTISLAKVTKKIRTLPEPAHFKELLENIAKKSGGWGKRIADQLEFLAYSGMRAFSEAQWTTWDDVDWKRNEIIVRGNPKTLTKNSEPRRIPIIPDMAKLLRRLEPPTRSGPVMKIRRCDDSLRRACQELRIPRITLHGLRHLFATRCIESGVDIPTVSRWLGHTDGGTLALKTYGHLRNDHSQAMAKKVIF